MKNLSENKERPLILVSNDDGFDAPGVRILAKLLESHGRVIVACPDRPRSGQSCAITVNLPLTFRLMETMGETPIYAVSGTPADCVKLAMHEIVDRKPDLVVAGINHGSNAAINAIYSGTMGAVFEGCAFGIPAIGFSLTDHSVKADFGGCGPFVNSIVSSVLKNGLKPGVCLNVNIPNCHPYPTEMRVVRECRGKWTDEYREYVDPFGRPFYWLCGDFINLEPEAEDTDEWCLRHGIVSVVPCLLERTAPLGDCPALPSHPD